MERERHGDAVRDGAQQNTCHIWSEENNNKHDQLANARKRALPPPPPLCRTAAVSLGGVARRAASLVTCGHFRLISIQIL